MILERDVCQRSHGALLRAVSLKQLFYIQHSENIFIVRISSLHHNSLLHIKMVTFIEKCKMAPRTAGVSSMLIYLCVCGGGGVGVEGVLKSTLLISVFIPRVGRIGGVV